MASKHKKKKGNHQKKGKITKAINENIPETQQETDYQLPEDESHGASYESTNKRKYEDGDSDTEDKPQKKKKKKQVVIESSEKKGKKSIRQMKREKFAERQVEAQAVAKDQLKSQCLNYLSQWKHNKSNWKFMKSKQVWLYKNKFSSQMLPDASWPILLEYFESAKGNIRNMLLDDANKVIKQMDEWTESQDKDNIEDNNAEKTSTNKPDETTYKRARDLIQCLQE